MNVERASRRSGRLVDELIAVDDVSLAFVQSRWKIGLPPGVSDLLTLSGVWLIFNTPCGKRTTAVVGAWIRTRGG